MSKHERFDIKGDLECMSLDVSEKLVEQLKDGAVAAAIEADARLRMWQTAARRLWMYKFSNRIGVWWYGVRGTLHYTDKDVRVQVEKIEAGYGGMRVIMARLTKTGKPGKTTINEDMAYVFDHFTAE